MLRLLLMPLQLLLCPGCAAVLPLLLPPTLLLLLSLDPGCVAVLPCLPPPLLLLQSRGCVGELPLLLLLACRGCVGVAQPEQLLLLLRPPLLGYVAVLQLPPLLGCAAVFLPLLPFRGCTTAPQLPLLSRQFGRAHPAKELLGQGTEEPAPAAPLHRQRWGVAQRMGWRLSLALPLLSVLSQPLGTDWSRVLSAPHLLLLQSQMPAG